MRKIFFSTFLHQIIFDSYEVKSYKNVQMDKAFSFDRFRYFLLLSQPVKCDIASTTLQLHFRSYDLFWRCVTVVIVSFFEITIDFRPITFSLRIPLPEF